MTDEKLKEINKLKHRIQEQETRLDSIRHLRSGITWTNEHISSVRIAGCTNNGTIFHEVSYDIDYDFIQNVLMLAEAYELIELDKLEKEYEAL